MQITALLTICIAALSGTAAAMPRISGAWRGARIAVEMPTNATSSHNATTTGTGAKAPLSTGSATNNTRTHATNHVNVNRCHELCSLGSQACSIAVPEDDKFCWTTYLQCTEKCRPEDF